MRKEVLVSAKRMSANKVGEPDEDDEKDFLETFGIMPSGNPRVANLEQQIIDQKLDELRGQVRMQQTALSQYEQRAKGERDPAKLAEIHRATAEIANRLDAIQEELNDAIVLARTFGFKPKVYRSAQRSR
jgi:ABC-type phosphate transport system auxiliary subunit